MQKLGINLDVFENLDYEEQIKIIQDLGFRATFSDMSYNQSPENTAELCNRYGLEYQFIHAIFKGINNMWLDNIDGNEMFKNLLSNIDSASRANVPIAVVHISSSYTPPPISQIGKDRFKALVDHAANKNVKIAFENLRVPEYLKWAMDTFNSNDWVGFCWDTGHENCFTKGIDYMSLYGDRLLCTHIHDNFGELAGDRHLIPFDGKIDFAKVASRLKNSDYNGPLMAEVFAKDSIYDNVTPFQFYTKAYKAIQKIQQMITN